MDTSPLAGSGPAGDGEPQRGAARGGRCLILGGGGERNPAGGQVHRDRHVHRAYAGPCRAASTGRTPVALLGGTSPGSGGTPPGSGSNPARLETATARPQPAGPCPGTDSASVTILAVGTAASAAPSTSGSGGPSASSRRPDRRAEPSPVGRRTGRPGPPARVPAGASPRPRVAAR